jgi:hypothetical protein
VGEVARGAVGVGAGEKCGSSGKLDVLWRLRRVVIGWWRDRLHRAILVDGRWHGMVHDGRMSHRPSTGGDRASALAAVAPMRKLVVVKTTSQLSLFQVGGNVFVWHLLEASLEKINFLQCHVSQESKHDEYSYLILTPSSATASGCLLSVLLNAEIVSVDGIHRGVVGLSHMGGGIHLVRWCGHDGR